MATWQVGTYRLYQYAGRTSGTLAVIRLEDAAGQYASHVYFIAQSALPTNSVSGTFYFLYYPYDTFAPMMEMLREEKPVYVYAPDPYNVYISTSQEPIGEDEGA